MYPKKESHNFPQTLQFLGYNFKPSFLVIILKYLLSLESITKITFLKWKYKWKYG